MKILLVNTNRNRTLSPLPLGLAYLSRSLKAQGHSVQLTDLMFAKNPREELRGALSSFQPQVVGLTIRNLDEQSMDNPSSPLPEIRELVKIVKDGGVTTILGGPAFSTFPEQMLQYMEADYGVIGQAEEGLTRLVTSIEEGEVDTSVPGLVWRSDDGVSRNPPAFTGYAGMQPDWAALDMKGYRSSIMPASVVVKTGCPYECSYCDAHATFGRCFNFREPETIVEDIRRFRQIHRCASFFLVDPCFNAPSDRAKEVLEAIIRADLGVYINTEIVPVTGEYDDELFRLYRRAGGIFGMIGTEALSPTMIESYRKPFTLDDVIECSVMAHKHGIQFGIVALFGGPGEDDATLQESLEACKHIPYAFLDYAMGIRVLPECELFDTAKEEAFVESKEELMFPKFYMSPKLDRDRARSIIDKGLSRYNYRKVRLLPFGLRSTLARFLDFAP